MIDGRLGNPGFPVTVYAWMRKRAAHLLFMAGVGMAAACNWSGSKPTEPPLFPTVPSGPRPVISMSLAFGESPIEGEVRLSPSSETANWLYAVDVDEDGAADHSGTLTREVEFAYRFSTPGVHGVRISLTGPTGVEAVTVPAIVNDPTAVRTLAQRITGGAANAIFEGITTNRAGTSLFVADFFNSTIYRLDPGDLRPLAPHLVLPRIEDDRGFVAGGPEGLTVTPSDTLLLVAHKLFGLSVVAIPALEPRRSLRMAGEYFIQAIDDVDALSTARGSLDLIDTNTGGTVRGLAVPNTWHFAVSLPSQIVAALNRSGPAAVHLANLADLQQIARVELPGAIEADVVAFDPAGDRLYVMGRDAQGSRFYLVDVPSRSVLLNLPLGLGACGAFCVANPVATSRNGRFVAMEQGGGVYFIDTTLDLPRYYLGTRMANSGLSVAASPTEEAFYLLQPDGFVRKVALTP